MSNQPKRHRATTLIERVELIEGEMLRAEEIARLCRTSTDWVMARVQDEILTAQWRDGVCYFSSATVWRARHIADLEAGYEADPQLAALVADLAEEIRDLRARLALLDH